MRLLTAHNEIDDAYARFGGCNVEVIEAPVDDIWMRDIAPTFALRGQQVVAIDWNFNGWGSTKTRPSRRGDQLAKIAEDVFGAPRISIPFVAEGGALIADGEGTIITTRSCLLNPNRNPTNVTELFIQRELEKLGIQRTIWLEGDPSEPLTSGHVDGYVLFNAPGALLVQIFDDEQVEPPGWRSQDIAVLEKTADATGRTLNVGRVRAPRRRYWRFQDEMFAPCYLNAYVANGAVITARYGDIERDEAAKNTLEQRFPGRAVVMLAIDHIAGGGGGIHCLTQSMPFFNGRNGT